MTESAAFTTLISAGQLQHQLANVRVFDCRFSLMDAESGQQDYAAEHIPGATYANLNTELSGPITPSTGRHPLPDRDTFVNQVQTWGIQETDQLVAYDADTGAFAARFWWMMRWLGHKNVCVLDGGFAAWQAQGLAVTKDTPTWTPSSYKPAPAMTRQVQAEDLPDLNACVIDARELARFRGEVEPIDPVAGHIPGAVCKPFVSNLHNGTFKPAAELKSAFGALVGGKNAICYCGSGVTAAHNILAMVHAGLPEPALYPGSWSHWVADPTRPVATGE